MSGQPGQASAMANSLALNAQGGAERMPSPAEAELATRAFRPDPGQPIHESLQGLVRHQLEMLATPVMRWEGDVWSGIFMSLLIQPPQQRPGEQDRSQQEDDEQRGDQSDEWHSSMILEVSGLGQVGVKLWLRDQHLELELTTGMPEVHSVLAEGLDQLRQRLEALDLADVQIRLRDQRLQPSVGGESQAA
jgi:hypothetical protein